MLSPAGAAHFDFGSVDRPVGVAHQQAGVAERLAAQLARQRQHFDRVGGREQVADQFPRFAGGQFRRGVFAVDDSQGRASAPLERIGYQPPGLVLQHRPVRLPPVGVVGPKQPELRVLPELKLAIGPNRIQGVQFEWRVAGVGDAGRDLQPASVAREFVGHFGLGFSIGGRTTEGQRGELALLSGLGAAGGVDRPCQLVAGTKRIVGAELIALGIALRQIDHRAGNVAHGHVRVAPRDGVGNDDHDVVVAQNPIAVDAIDFFPLGYGVVPRAFRQANHLDRTRRWRSHDAAQ